MVQNNNYQQKVIDIIRENYLSIALGFLVFLIAVALIFRSAGSLSNNKVNELTGEGGEAGSEKTYTVRAGDSISSIARDQLGSMEHTQAIIDANNIKNPDLIEVGTKIKLPEVTPIKTAEPTKIAGADKNTVEVGEKGSMTGKITITGSTYVVKKGDHLWNIALRAYGDGNMYTKILKANNLKNPDRIEAGIVLKLPR